MEKRACEESLAEFIRQAWHIVEPGQPYIHGWHLDAICDHLEAVTYGDLTRLLINVPPGMMKSLSTSVFWPAWEWGPKRMPHMRVIGTSHSQSLAIRDTTKMRRLVASQWYQERWGDQVKLTRDQNAKLKFENMATGFREAAAAGSITGSRGDRVVIDDPHSVESAASDAMRASTIEWFLEAIPTRLNKPEESAIIVIMQRLHEEDVSGVILEKELGYEHLCLPMRFDPSRKCYTGIGFEDPREGDGDLLFPERFPDQVVDDLEKSLGTYATAGQLQQSPAPRGGGIIKREYWQLWDEIEARKNGVAPIPLTDKVTKRPILDAYGAQAYAITFPRFEYVIASLDTAFTEKEENDPSAFTVWGVWRDLNGNSRLMLVTAWAERLELNDLVTKAAESCTKFKVDRLLIEAKASGHSVAQEILRLHSLESWVVQLINPGAGDKVARAYAVQAIFEAGLVYAPDRRWADMVISQCATFPKGKHDDLVDSTTQALAHLRLVGMAEMPKEHLAQIENDMRSWKKKPPLYEVV